MKTSEILPEKLLFRTLQVLFLMSIGLITTCLDSPIEIGAASQALTAQPDLHCDTAEFGTHQYWFCKDNRAWETARVNCADIGMHLVRVDNPGENEFIARNIETISWIGASDSETEGDWRWLFENALFWTGGNRGQPVDDSYENWESRSPQDDELLNCGAVKHNTGQWSDKPCESTKHYICESSPETETYSEAPDTGCNLTEYNGHEYWFCNDKRPFEKARDNCRAIGMDLATVDDADENSFIKQKLGVDSFIGLSDTETEGIWKWLAENSLA